MVSPLAAQMPRQTAAAGVAGAPAPAPATAPGTPAPTDPNVSTFSANGALAGSGMGPGSGTPGAQTLNPNGPLASFFQLYGPAILGPAWAQADATANQLTGQIGYADAQKQVGTDQANQANQNALARLGIQQGDNAFNADIENRRWGLVQQGYGLNRNELGYQGEQLGLSRQDLAQQMGDAQHAEKEQERAIRSRATAGGSINTEGTGHDFGEAQFNLAEQMKRFGRQGQQLDISGKRLGDAGKREQITEQQGGLSHEQAQHQLADMSKSLGISATEIQQRLDNTLQQLGMSDAFTTNQLLSEIKKVQLGKYSPISGMLSTIYQMSGIQVPTPGSGG